MKRRPSNQGLTMIEFAIAGMIALIVVLAFARIVLGSKRSFDWNIDKAILQQNASEGLEWMTRSIRSAHRLTVTSPSAFSTRDSTGAIIHTYLRTLVAGKERAQAAQGRLREDGQDLIARNCTRFVVTPDPDTTSLTLLLELEDNSGNRVEVHTRAAVRNRHFAFK